MLRAALARRGVICGVATHRVDKRSEDRRGEEAGNSEKGVKIARFI